ncbi:MAG: metallophosphoesterase [Clostridia bacterium]|nr:metallophosphoesterase [Clostridia bacterium]
MKKLLSLVLVVLMVLSVIPLTALAAETTPSWVIEDFANTSDCSVSGLTGRTDGTENGFQTVKGTAASSVTFSKSISPAISITDYDKAYLALNLKFYISDPTQLKTAGAPQIELTSSGKCDVNELHWNFSSLTLKAGWNDLTLDFSDGVPTGGELDITKINYMRIYAFFSASVEVGFGPMTIITTRGGARFDGSLAIVKEGMSAMPQSAEAWFSPSITNKDPLLISDFDNTDQIPVTDSCGANTKTYTIDGGATVLNCNVAGGQWISLRHETLPSTTGIALPAGHGMADLGLAFRVYIEDVSAITSANIELANTAMDTNEISWNLAGINKVQQLQNGWNEVVLPFNTRNGTTNGDFTISQIKWWRFNFNNTANGTNVYKMDYLKIVSLVDSDLPSVAQQTYLFSYTDDQDNSQGLFADQNGSLYWLDGETVVSLGVSIANNVWTHVAYTLDPATKTLSLYMNGQLVATKQLSATMPAGGVFRVGIGPDGFDGQVFLGKVGDVRVWTDVRTANEIQTNYQLLINAPTDGLYANWRLNDDFSFISAVPKDQVGTNHASVLWRDWSNDWIPYEETENYDYTFAVVPDPQILAALYPDIYRELFQYIADNAESQKIEYVLNLGDITNSNSDAEWKVARSAYDIIEGKVPYANVLGNHDYGDWTQPYRDTTRFNQYFSYNDHKTRSDWGGAYEEGKLDNAYYRFTVGQTPYLVLCLEFLPRDGAINWANQVVASHPDDNVIVMTHGYIYGQTGEIASEPQSDYGFILNNPDPYNGGQKIWDKLISQHENIIMSLCGHTFCKDDNVIMRADPGVNGNTVIQLCLNAQTMDEAYFDKTGVGMLGLLRFSENGQKVALQYYSPHTGMCFREVNQLEFQLNTADQAPFTAWTENLNPMYHLGLSTATSADANWNNYRYIAQPFVPETETLYGVQLPLNLTSGTANLHMEIRSSVNGQPLASSDTVITSQGDKMAWYDIPLSAPLTVDAGKPYYIVYYLTARDAGSVCIVYGSDLGANKATHPGSVWQMASGEPITFSTLANQHHFGFQLVTQPYANPDLEIAAQVVAQIDTLTVQSLEDKPAVEAARAAYNDLTDAQKALVTNLDKLTQAEAKIAEWETAAAIKYGDVDGDGRVSAADALEVLKAVVGNVTLTEEQTVFADVDSDERISAVDALEILKKVVGKIDKFPVEE